MKIVPYDNLRNSDLIVDAVYEGGGSVGELGDPISKVLPGCGNLGGFRAAGRGEIKKFVVLYTSGEDKDWPDTLDLNTGRFTYYGDNKTPGHELHDTPKKGNLILRNVFDWLHADPPRRENVPPFFVFVKYPTKNSSRSVQFKGLAVPGFPGLTATEDLIAVWKTSDSQRFQNYRSTFTVLDVATVEREWIRDLKAGKADTEKAPPAWRTWKQQGMYTPLTSEPTTIIRSVESQSPDNELQESILETVFEYFKDTPTNFEAFAAKVFQLFDQRVIIDEITRGTVDGGRDAVGRYLLGIPDDPVYAEFALEAKCYRPPLRGKKVNTVGVKEVSRLIARLRHRQFGILVTTSVVAKQAYEEVRLDRHPVVFICGKDIAEILVSKGFNTPEVVRRMLENEFPK
jgi:hypothetical protein